MSTAELTLTAKTSSPETSVAFLRQEFLRVLKSRPAALVIAAVVYSMVALPFLLAKPHEEILVALQNWFGASHLDFRLFLFVWFDMVMNKISILIGAVLASGIITDERSKGLLDLYLSKPLSPRRYFLMKLAAVLAVVLVIYGAAMLVGTIRFSASVKGFDTGVFLLLASVHLLVALFSAVFAATLAVFFRHKLSAMLTTVVVLSILVGCAFLGFYDPRFQTISLLNPFYHAIVLIGSIDAVAPLDVVKPMLWLVGFNVVTAIVGARRAATLGQKD
ncbi:MAG: ABC transporter permease [Blastocatellia bacterium]|nr:ABC transporter permease [Blastocatellia bacterium]